LTDQWPIVSTSFALLFLRKADAGLISSWPTRPRDNGWNASTTTPVTWSSTRPGIVQATPLAWQVYDLRRLGSLNETEIPRQGRRATRVADLVT